MPQYQRPEPQSPIFNFEELHNGMEQRVKELLVHFQKMPLSEFAGQAAALKRELEQARLEFESLLQSGNQDPKALLPALQTLAECYDLIKMLPVIKARRSATPESPAVTYVQSGTFASAYYNHKDFGANAKESKRKIKNEKGELVPVWKVEFCLLEGEKRLKITFNLSCDAVTEDEWRALNSIFERIAKEGKEGKPAIAWYKPQQGDFKNAEYGHYLLHVLGNPGANHAADMLVFEAEGDGGRILVHGIEKPVYEGDEIKLERAVPGGMNNGLSKAKRREFIREDGVTPQNFDALKANINGTGLTLAIRELLEEYFSGKTPEGLTPKQCLEALNDVFNCQEEDYAALVSSLKRKSKDGSSPEEFLLKAAQDFFGDNFQSGNNNAELLLNHLNDRPGINKRDLKAFKVLFNVSCMVKKSGLQSLEEFCNQFTTILFDGMLLLPQTEVICDPRNSAASAQYTNPIAVFLKDLKRDLEEKLALDFGDAAAGDDAAATRTYHWTDFIGGIEAGEQQGFASHFVLVVKAIMANIISKNKSLSLSVASIDPNMVLKALGILEQRADQLSPGKVEAAHDDLLPPGTPMDVDGDDDDDDDDAMEVDGASRSATPTTEAGLFGRPMDVDQQQYGVAQQQYGVAPTHTS